jgi:hypothetical protein
MEQMKKTNSNSANKVIFSLQWPFAREVFVAGTFNDGDPRKDQLKENPDRRSCPYG